MIKIENTEVHGWQAAIRGMRNPMNSWDRSDSFLENMEEYIVGENDMQLMRKLVAAGTDHSKFMRMITVTCDITAPLYWWKECDTYKVGTVRNSCSTMHRIHEKEFTFDDFSHEHLVGKSMLTLEHTIEAMNYERHSYLVSNDKDCWWQLIQLLPSSYNQRATLQLNYAVLRSIYFARKNHRLDEWREFCRWIEGLPYAELLTMEKEEL